MSSAVTARQVHPAYGHEPFHPRGALARGSNGSTVMRHQAVILAGQLATHPRYSTLFSLNWILIKVPSFTFVASTFHVFFEAYL